MILRHAPEQQPQDHHDQTAAPRALSARLIARGSRCLVTATLVSLLSGVAMVRAETTKAPQPLAVMTSGHPDAICDRAAQTAARITGVPVAVLRTIARLETGRRRDGSLQPWPWAMNRGGQSHWFDTQEALMIAAEGEIAAGHTNLDLGCFQMNLRWHAQRFNSLRAMTDPATNALQAARFLAELYAETGNWSQAAGAYHSRSAAHGKAYRARFDDVLADLGAQAPPTGGVSRHNAYPLLQGAQQGARGSLVPQLAMARPLLGDAGS